SKIETNFNQYLKKLKDDNFILNMKNTSTLQGIIYYQKINKVTFKFYNYVKDSFLTFCIKFRNNILPSYFNLNKRNPIKFSDIKCPLCNHDEINPWHWFTECTNIDVLNSNNDFKKEIIE